MAVVWAAVISAAAGLGSSALQSKGAKEQANAQADAATQAGKAGKAFAFNQNKNLDELSEEQFSRIAGLNDAFTRSSNVFDFTDQTDIEIGELFSSETQRKRDNFDFINGGTSDELREIQQENAELAAGNFSNFLGEVEATTIGALAGTEGRPIGSFENLSARNSLLARSRGTTNLLGINDYIAREGTVDPPSAFSVFGAASGVAEFEAREDAEELSFRERQLDRELGLADSIFNRGFEIDRLGLLAETDSLEGAASSAGLGSYAAGATLASLGQGASTISQAYATKSQAEQNNQFQQDYLDLLRSQSYQQNAQALEGTTGV